MAGEETPGAEPTPEGEAEETLLHHRVEHDAMGHDKRRAVVGHSYGPSMRQQLTVYGSALAVIVVLAVGFWLLARELDQPPDVVEIQAPWAQADAAQRTPKGIDQTPP